MGHQRKRGKGVRPIHCRKPEEIPGVKGANQRTFIPKEVSPRQTSRTSVPDWVEDLPDEFDAMNPPPPPKRTRSQSSTQLQSSAEEASATTRLTPFSRDVKFKPYAVAEYEYSLQINGYHMRPSAAGPTDEDRDFCRKLLEERNGGDVITRDSMLHDDIFEQFLRNLRNRSEARVT